MSVYICPVCDTQCRNVDDIVDVDGLLVCASCAEDLEAESSEDSQDEL